MSESVFIPIPTELSFYPHSIEYDHVYDVNAGIDGTYRVFSHEINTEDKPADLIEDAYEIISFSQGNLSESKPENSPVLEEPIKDLIGALQLDGLSKFSAIEYIVNNHMIEKEKNIIVEDYKKEIQEKIKLPGYYYRLKDEFRKYFMR
jgi:hypothetical protein